MVEWPSSDLRTGSLWRRVRNVRSAWCPDSPLANGTLLSLVGDLNRGGEADLFAGWSQGGSPGARSVRIELSGLTRMDTSGQLSLVSLGVKVRSQGASLSVAGASPYMSTRGVGLLPCAERLHGGYAGAPGAPGAH
jgi:ABC-type transporter Mla MlaB component